MEVYELSCYESRGKMPYREFNCHKLGFFSSIDNAEQIMIRFIEDSKQDDIIGFIVNEWELDHYNADMPSSNSLSRRSYDRNGKMLAYSPYDTDGKLCFRGRDETDCPFKVGDIVEIIGIDTMNLSIIASLPFDKRYMSKLLRKKDYDENEYSTYNYGDDCCCTLPVDDNVNAHDHTLITEIFPVYETIPESIVKHLRSKV